MEEEEEGEEEEEDEEKEVEEKRAVVFVPTNSFGMKGGGDRERERCQSSSPLSASS